MRIDPCNSWCAPDNAGICRYCGWPKDRTEMGLQLYDVHTDQTREATQEDIEGLQAMANAYGALRAAVADTHARLLTQIEDIKRRHTPLLVEVPDPVVPGA